MPAFVYHLSFVLCIAGLLPAASRKVAAPGAVDAADAQPDAATTALFNAVHSNDVAAVRTALARGAHIDDIIPNGGGQTSLMAASLAGHAEVVSALLDAGADPTIGERDGYTPMHGAGFQGRAAVARVLLQHSHVPNTMHKDGFAPIHRACWGREPRHAEAVSAFIEGGVDPLLPTAKGLTPLEIAKQSGNKDTIRVLTIAEARKKADEL